MDKLCSDGYENDDDVYWCVECDGECKGYIGEKSCSRAMGKREDEINCLVKMFLSCDKEVSKRVNLELND